MKNEFTLAFNEVLEDKQLPKEVVLEALEAAMVSAYRRAVNASNAQLVEAKVDPETGKVAIFAEKEVVESVQDPRTEVTLNEARKADLDAEIGSIVTVESTPNDFGRVAAQTARQVIQQRIREAERDAQLDYFSKQIGEIVSGVVQAVNSQAVTLGLDMKAEGIMPRNQQIGGERFRLHDRVRALLLEVKSTPRGPQIILSRAHRNFLRRLLENEVPEIYHGLVEVRSIAREPGQRSKVAVAALQAGVDPVGACVGIRGVRIQAIVRELNDEKIDVIEWNPDPAAYIAKALSPARVTGVYLNEFARGTKTATVVVPEDQLSLAIGRDGQNARLAAKLTSWRIDIKSLPEAAADALYKLQNNSEFAAIAAEEADNVAQIEIILGKKSEGRPVTPEEYTMLAQFVDRVERGIIEHRHEKKRIEKERREAAVGAVPEEAFEMQLEELELSTRVHSLLEEAGYDTVGDLMVQMHMDSDAITDLSGVGPKSIEEIETTLSEVSFPEVEEEAVVEVEEQVPSETVTPKVEEAEPVAEPTSSEEQVEVQVPAEELPVEEAAAEAILEEVAEEVEAPEEAALEEEPVAAAQGEVAVEEVEQAPEEEEQPSPLDELFDFKPEDFEKFIPDEEEFEEEEEEEEGSGKGKKKKKKKKKKYVELEYDPEQDVVIVKRKRKRGGGDWDDNWEY
ncbi:MAG: transcription termination factor NusA [Anaerolineales bacterium]|jgi:N utilization substance protein A